MRPALRSVLVLYRPTGSEGEQLIRIPASPQSWNVAKATPNAISASRLIAPGDVFPILSDRPVIVMLGLSWLRFRSGFQCASPAALGSGGGRLPRRGDQMAMPHNDFVDGPQAAILGRKLTLFDRAFDVEVLTLLESEGDIGKIAIELQVMPVGVLLPLLVSVLISVALAQPNVGHRGSGRKVANFGPFR